LRPKIIEDRNGGRAASIRGVSRPNWTLGAIGLAIAAVAVAGAVVVGLLAFSGLFHSARLDRIIDQIEANYAAAEKHRLNPDLFPPRH